MIYKIENEEEFKSLLEETQAVAVYFYTPLCGTCKTAERMLTIVSEIVPQIKITYCNINMMPTFAQQWKIRSVPYLAILKNGRVNKEVYAFQSVDHIYHLLKKYML